MYAKSVVCKRVDVDRMEGGPMIGRVVLGLVKRGVGRQGRSGGKRDVYRGNNPLSWQSSDLPRC